MRAHTHTPLPWRIHPAQGRIHRLLGSAQAQLHEHRKMHRLSLDVHGSVGALPLGGVAGMGRGQGSPELHW